MKDLSTSTRKLNASLNSVAQHNYRIGKQRYLLLYGLAIYGGVLFASCQIWAFCVNSDQLSGRWLAFWLIFSILLNACAGLLVGWLLWRWSERRALRISRER